MAIQEEFNQALSEYLRTDSEVKRLLFLTLRPPIRMDKVNLYKEAESRPKPHAPSFTWCVTA